MVNLASAHEVAGEGELGHFLDELGDKVGGHADDPGRADGHEGERERVVAGKDGDIAQAANFAGDIERIRGLFDGNDIGVFAEAGDGLGEHGDAGAGGDIVQDDRQIHLVGEGHEVAVEALLRGLVVIGIDRKTAVGAGRLGKSVKLQGLAGGIGAGAGDYRDAGVGGLHGDLNHALVLAKIESGRLAGGAGGDEAVDSFGDLELNVFLKLILVEHAIIKRSNQRCEGTLQQHYF